jgi:hypothetical protein
MDAPISERSYKHAAAEPRLGRGHPAYKIAAEFIDFVGPVPTPGDFIDSLRWQFPVHLARLTLYSPLKSS